VSRIIVGYCEVDLDPLSFRQSMLPHFQWGMDP
jgi:hypothetical protein